MHGVGEVGARLRVEIDPQLVRVVDVGAANRPRVKRDRAHLRRPADDGDLRRADLIGVPARRELDLDGLDVVRGPPGDALLEEGVAAPLVPGGENDAGMDALRPALERGRPLLERAHDAVLHRQVVVDDVELGDRLGAVGRREDHAVGVGHAQRRGRRRRRSLPRWRAYPGVLRQLECDRFPVVRPVGRVQLVSVRTPAGALRDRKANPRSRRSATGANSVQCRPGGLSYRPPCPQTPLKALTSPAAIASPSRR